MAFHVDEINHNKTRHIAQTQLACNFDRSFHIGAERGLLNPMALCGAA